MWLLYQIVVLLGLVTVGPLLLLRRGRHYWQSLPGRLGRYQGEVPHSPLWIHAVSVGEVGVATTLIRALSPGLPLLVTTITPTGQRRAQSALRDRAAIAYLPFDLGFAVERFLARFRPRAVILMEGDLWPLVLSRAKRRGLRVVVVNGRVGDRTYRRLLRLRRLLKPVLGPVDRFAMQSEEDRQRLLSLGVPAERVVVTGNLKFDSPPPTAQPELLAAIGERAAGRPVVVAGSTMPAEEQLVLDAFDQLGGGQRVLLVLAPRHPERWPEVDNLARQRGLTVARRSQLALGPKAPDVLLLDSLGELAAVYEIGSGCFIGGTLVDSGGHNPLEAARHGVAIAVGPSMENFREIAAAFDSAEAWQRVASAAQLAETWNGWLENPRHAADLGARGKAVVAANRGALRATLGFLQPLIDLTDDALAETSPSAP